MLYNLPNTSLGKVFETTTNSNFFAPKNEKEDKTEGREEGEVEEKRPIQPRYEFRGWEPQGNAHDAAFDAYMTGASFASMREGVSEKALASVVNQVNIFGCIQRVLLGREDEKTPVEDLLVIHDFDPSLDNMTIQNTIKEATRVMFSGGEEGEEGKEGERGGKKVPVKWKWIDDTSFFFIWVGEGEGEGEGSRERFWGEMEKVEMWKVKKVELMGGAKKRKIEGEEEEEGEKGKEKEEER